MSTVDDNELIGILIVPNDSIDPIRYLLNMVIGLSCREKQVDLSILMLKDQFGSILVGKSPEDRVVRFMLHDYRLILDVIVLQSIGIIEVDEEHFGHEILDHLTITLNREHSFLAFALNLNKMDFIFVVQNGCPSVTHFHPFNVVLALDLVDLLPP